MSTIIPMKNIKIITGKYPNLNISIDTFMTITSPISNFDKLVAGSKIIVSDDTTYNKWNYNSDGSISSATNPNLVISTTENKVGSSIVLVDKTSAQYATWTLRAIYTQEHTTHKAFTLDANSNLYLAVGRTSGLPKTNDPLILSTSASDYNDWHITTGPMPNISLAATQNQKLLISAPNLTNGGYLVLGGNTSPNIIWNYNVDLTISPANNPYLVLQSAGTNKTNHVKLVTRPAKANNFAYNSTLWIWNAINQTFNLFEFPSIKLSTNKLDTNSPIYAADYSYNKWTIVCNKGADFNTCVNWCGDPVNASACALARGETCKAYGKNMWNIDFCKDFCLTTSDPNKASYCDENMQKYCSDQTKSPVCGCVKSQFPGTKGFCVDPNCIPGTSYYLSQQPASLCKGTTCVQYVSGQGSDYYQKAKQVMCCNASTGKLSKKGSGTTCQIVPNKPPKTDTTILGVIGASSSSSLSCCLLLIILFLIYYLLE